MESALGNLCLVPDNTPHGRGAKLGSLKIVFSEEGFYMLAAFCFDLTRKMDYIYKATREFAPHAGKALAQEIKKDNARVFEPGLPWKTIAEREEEIIRKLYGEIAEEHQKLLDEAAR